MGAARLWALKPPRDGRTLSEKIALWRSSKSKSLTARHSHYAQRDGMRVPLAGEVAWLTPDARLPYWRGTIEQLAYEFAK